MTESSARDKPEEVAVWEDFVDIFHAPSEVFARRRRSGFWVPLMVVAILSTVLSFARSRLLGPVIEADTGRQMRLMLRQNPELDLSAGRGTIEALETFAVYSAGLFEAIMTIVVGLILVAGTRIAGSRLTAREGILIATYSAVVMLMFDIAPLVEGLMRGPSNLESMSQLQWSPARFLDPDTATPLQKFLASRLDVFTIWWLALLAIGLAILSGMPRARAAAVVVGIWVLASLPVLIGALTS